MVVLLLDLSTAVAWILPVDAVSEDHARPAEPLAPVVPNALDSAASFEFDRMAF